MEKQQRAKKLDAHVLVDLEACGLRAHLREVNREVSDDKNGERLVRQEIARAYAANDQAQLPDAFAAQRWLVNEPGSIVQVGGVVDLVDEAGEVLASGPVGAVLEMENGEVLVASWVVGEHYNYPEPEEDLGLVATGLASCTVRGQVRPFRVAHVYLLDGEAFARRSDVYAPESHQALWERIRAAANRPRVACPGSRCGHCKQAQYCDAWLKRARAASAVMTTELVLNDEGKVEVVKDFELTNENASAFYERLEYASLACKFGDELAKAFVRKGGRIVFDGKLMYMAPRNGRKTVSADDFKAAVTKLIDTLKAADPVDAKALEMATGMLSLIKVGNASEAKAWKAPTIGGGRR